MPMRPIDQFLLATGQLDICGNPYHGLIDGNGDLDTGVVDPGIIGGLYAGPDTYVHTVPGTPPIVRTQIEADDDAVYGQEWRDSDLIGKRAGKLYSSTGRIGWSNGLYVFGHKIDMGLPSWLYSDPDGNTWIIMLYSQTKPAGFENYDWLYGGHFSPLAAAVRFDQIPGDGGIITVAQLDTPATLTFPNGTAGVAMLPHSYPGPIEAYGDWDLSSIGYTIEVLDVTQGGAKVLLGCAVTFRDPHSGNHPWIRSVIEATVSGTGDTGGTEQGYGITIDFALLYNVDECESHNRNWDVDYIDLDDNPGHYTGPNPASQQANWKGVTLAECDYLTRRLMAAWYDGGTIKKRFMEHTRHGEHVFYIDGFSHSHANRVETEQLSYWEGTAVLAKVSEFNTVATLLLDYDPIGLVVSGTESLKQMDLWVVGDAPAMTWTYTWNGSPPWIKTGESYAKNSYYETAFTVNAEVDGGYSPIFLSVFNVSTFGSSDASLGFVVAWSPLSMVFLFGYRDMAWGAPIGGGISENSRHLRIQAENYGSDLIHGWSMDRWRMTPIDVNHWRMIADGWWFKDLCTPNGVSVDGSRQTSGTQAYDRWVTSYARYNSILEAAYDRYTGETAWGTAPGAVMGYV